MKSRTLQHFQQEEPKYRHEGDVLTKAVKKRRSFAEKKNAWKQRKGTISKSLSTLDAVGEVVDTTKLFLKGFVGTATEAPLNLVDNEFIRRGYRIGYHGSIKSILKSLFQMHNESVNVWSHLLGMFFFATMVFYTNLTSFKDMGSFVASGMQQARQQNEHFIEYFQNQLHQIEEDLGAFYSYGFYNESAFPNQTEFLHDGSILANDQNKTRPEYWGSRMLSAIHRVEGLAWAFVSQLSHFKTYVSEEEQIIEQKLYEWKEHVQHFPEELKKRIYKLQHIIQNQTNMSQGLSSFGITNNTNTRLNYLAGALRGFQSRMTDMQNGIISRIDKMEWLDVIDMLSNHEHPIEDIDEFLNYASKWPLFAHMITAALCLGFSATYHLFFIYSPEVYLLLAKLDYAGILLLMFGSTMPGVNYIFACPEVSYLKVTFISIIGVSCIAGFIVSLMPVFSTPSFKPLRGILFLGVGVSLISPLTYLSFYFDPTQMMQPNHWQFILGCLIYALGAFLYMTRVPERCKPGTFDMCGHSHQLFHICVLIACSIHYFENLLMYHRRQEFTCPVPK